MPIWELVWLGKLIIGFRFLASPHQCWNWSCLRWPKHIKDRPTSITLQKTLIPAPTHNLTRLYISKYPERIDCNQLVHARVVDLWTVFGSHIMGLRYICIETIWAYLAWWIDMTCQPSANGAYSIPHFFENLSCPWKTAIHWNIRQFYGIPHGLSVCRL